MVIARQADRIFNSGKSKDLRSYWLAKNFCTNHKAFSITNKNSCKSKKSKFVALNASKVCRRPKALLRDSYLPQTIRLKPPKLHLVY